MNMSINKHFIKMPKDTSHRTKCQHPGCQFICQKETDKFCRKHSGIRCEFPGCPFNKINKGANGEKFCRHHNN